MRDPYLVHNLQAFYKKAYNFPNIKVKILDSQLYINIHISTFILIAGTNAPTLLDSFQCWSTGSPSWLESWDHSRLNLDPDFGDTVK